jgi:hypothetical protein
MLEIKIIFKNGHIGYFTGATEEEPNEENVLKLRELIRNAKQKEMRGSFELKELKTGYLTVIDVQEVATFGTRIVEKVEVLSSYRKINKKSKK